MSDANGELRDATDDEIEELKRIAIEQHAKLGMDHASDLVIELRVRSLATERGLTIPRLSEPCGPAARPRARRHPNNLEAGIEQMAQQCAVQRRQAKLQKHIRIIRENSDRFYLFCFLQGRFARVLRKSRALEVFTAVIERAGGDIETWISVATLAALLGRTDKTVRKGLRALEGKKIISLIDAATVQFSLNGKPIPKSQGYVIRLHAPMLWDWNSVGGIPAALKKYLADYEDEVVDNSGDPGNGYRVTPVTVTTDF